MLLADVAAASRALRETSARNEKVELIADLLGHAAPNEVAVLVAALSGEPRQGRVGVGWASARVEARSTTPTLGVADLDRLIDDLAAARGEGVREERRRLLAEFGDHATVPEAEFTVRLLTGEMRQGALSGVVEQAVAKAEGIPLKVVRRAGMLTGDPAATAELARTGGRAALEAVRFRLGVPVSPMLASSSPSVTEAVQDLATASVEWKLDGIRVQAHVQGDRVRIFTRNLNDITDRLAGVAGSLAALGLPPTVLDGEAIGETASGRPAMFQDTVSDAVGSGADVSGAAVSGDTVMRAHWFDVLHHGGVDLLDEPLATRIDVIESIEGLGRIESTATSDPTIAEAVMESALEAGHEGVVVKSLEAPYAAGRRGKAWRKVKPVHTLDLVVIGVEWGSGRRRGTLSNLHLGAMGPDGVPVMVGKTFKGLTDELLAWQTGELLARETGRDGHIVWVRPELVVEIALDGVQRSTRYPGGVSLRFARVRRYRPDKTVAEADRIDAVRSMLP